METHGNHHFHPGQNADNGFGAAGIVQEIVGDVQISGSHSAGVGIQLAVNGNEDRREPISLIGIFGSAAKQCCLCVEVFPLTKCKANVLATKRNSGTQHNTVGFIIFRGGKCQSGVCGQQNFWFCNAHGLQFFQRVRFTKRDRIHTLVQNLGSQIAVGSASHGADAAAIHLHVAAGLFGGVDIVQIEPQGTAGGDILNQAAAAVDIELCMAHGLPPGEKCGAVDCLNAVSEAGSIGILAENGHGHVGVNGTHLLQNCFQNCIVTHISAAVGTADDHAVPILFGAVVAAYDLVVNIQLGIHGFLNGILSGCLFKELFSQLVSQMVVIADGSQMAAQRFPVTGLEQEAVYILIDQIGNTADRCCHGSQVEPCAFGQGIGESLGQGGQSVDVQSGIETVHAAGNPAGKRDLLFHAQFFGEGFQFLAFLAVTGNYQTQTAAVLITGSKTTHQRGHILDRIQASGNTNYHAVFVHIGTQCTQIFQTVTLRGSGGEINAVVDCVEPIRREAALDQQIHHGIRNADPVVQMTQGPGIDVAERQAAERAAHVVQLIIAVHGANNGEAGCAAQQSTHHVGTGAVAVDDLIVSLFDICGQLTAQAGNVIAPHDLGRDAHAAGFLGEGTVAETDHLGSNGFVQILQQAQHMGFCAAGVTAAD